MSDHTQVARLPVSPTTSTIHNYLFLLAELRKMWTHRWIAIVVAIVVSIAGWVVVSVLPDTYQARARIYLDTQSMLGPLLKGLAIENNHRQMEVAKMTRKTLLRRPNLEKVARETDKDLEAKTPQDLERVIQQLANSIDITGGSRDSIFVITSVDKDPMVAKKVVEILLSLFVESTLGSMRSDTGRTEKFLDKQIIEYRLRLEAAETRLKQFKRKNVGLMPTEAGGYFSRLQMAKDKLDYAQLELREAKKKRDELQVQLSRASPDFTDTSASSASSASSGARVAMSVEEMAISQRIANLESQLDQLKLQYTSSHPDVISLQHVVERLRSKLTSLRNTTTVTAVVTGQSRGRSSGYGDAYQQLRVAVGEAEADVSALNVRWVEYEKRVQSLQDKMAIIPDVEAELSRLNRDYAINKSNYESLVARRESAAISRDAEQDVDAIQFRIIDPPIAPALPTGPNRPMLLTLVLLLGLGMGGGLAWLRTQIQGTICSVQELETMTGGMVLGGVSRVDLGKNKIVSQAAVILFILLVSMLLMAYGIQMLMAVFHAGNVMALVRMFSTI